ncbi:recombinase family protein [bacterium AH-315-M10]|nr:recombinase family protein [bacterium AH-315-M10]
MMKMKVIAYVRVSTQEQADLGVSIEAQGRAIRAYCEMRGLDLVEVVIDKGVSAGKSLDRRPGGQRVLEMVRSKKAQAVVAWKLDRLFRDCADCLTVTRTWDKLGVSLHLIDLGGQAVDTSSAMGRFFLTVMAGAAELERNQVRERTAFAMRLKADKGEYCGGKRPFGYSIAEVKGTLVLIEDDQEQEIIRMVVELREAGLSYRKIGAELIQRGVLPRTGGIWHAQQIRRMIA